MSILLPNDIKMKIKTLDITHSNINSKKAKIPIYSISVHPTQYRLATAGQGRLSEVTC